MRVLVTAGGTREPIDSVRVIANTSTGRLGARIAEAFADAGHEVVLLHAAQCVLPASRRCERHQFETTDELAALLAEHAPRAQAVVHAAAVSDYLPERVPGKLSSERPELLLRLVPAPKLVDSLRELSPHSWLVGFKLTDGLGEVGMLAAAQRLRRRARLDLVVANDVARTGERDHHALLVDEDGVVERCRGKSAIARALLLRLEGRAVPTEGPST